MIRRLPAKRSTLAAGTRAQCRCTSNCSTWLRTRKSSVDRFCFRRSPEIETDWYNFTAIKVRKIYGAIDAGTLLSRCLRSDVGHGVAYSTSRCSCATPYASADDKGMQSALLPRRQRATHSPMFHQVEGYGSMKTQLRRSESGLHQLPAMLLRNRRAGGALSAFVFSVHRAIG